MSAATLSTAETDLVTNDKPVLIASSAMAGVSVAIWYTSAAADITSETDQAHEDFPSTRAHDRRNHTDTRTSGSASTFYFGAVLGTTAPAFDCLAILGHNFGAIGGLTVTAEIADDATFSTNLHTIATFSPSSDKRLMTFDLKHTGSDPIRYTPDGTTPNAQFFRLKITKGSAFSPKIGEIWIGRRRHLPFKLDEELDDKRTVSTYADFESVSGAIKRYVLNRGRLERSGSTVIDNAADIATVESFWSESDEGTKAFLYCEDPGSNPEKAALMHHQGGFEFPLIGPGVRQLGLELREAAPFVSQE
tara:strand:- start:1304 stop:2218 length:915 start_codon:yes stop_codon:yes gene_type:complete